MHFPIFVIFLLMYEIVTQELTLCQLPRINSKCVLTCKTPDLKRTVSFIGQGDKLGSCDADFEKPVCSTFNDNYLISVNESAGETNLTISSLSKDENEGYWHCEYDKKQSERKKLQLYDVIFNTSLVSDPIVSEREDSIIIHFQTDCLMPEPTTALKCKNGEGMCKVSPLENQKCEKPSLRIYNVTCNTTDECFLEKKTKVKIKVNDNIIEHKVIMYNKNDIIYNTSLVSDPIVKEMGDFVRIHFQTKCLMPEPTSSIICKNGVEICKVSTFEKWKCEQTSFRTYNVTCNTTPECFIQNEPRIEIKVNGKIIEEKVIKYTKRPKKIIEVSDTSYDETSIVVPIIIAFLVIIMLGIWFTLKYRQTKGKMCNCRKTDKSKSIQGNHQMMKQQTKMTV